MWDRLHAILLARLHAANSSTGPGRDRLQPRPGRPKGPKADRAGRSRTAGQQTPRPRSRGGESHSRVPDRRNRNDVTQVVTLLAGGSPCPRTGRAGPAVDPTPSSATAATTRQIPSPRVGERSKPVDRPTGTTPRLRPRARVLGRGTHHCVAARLPSPPHPLGTTRRHPRSPPRPRRLPHHPPTRETPLLGPLSHGWRRRDLITTGRKNRRAPPGRRAGEPRTLPWFRKRPSFEVGFLKPPRPFNRGRRPAPWVWWSRPDAEGEEDEGGEGQDEQAATAVAAGLLPRALRPAGRLPLECLAQ